MLRAMTLRRLCAYVAVVAFLFPVISFLIPPTSPTWLLLVTDRLLTPAFAAAHLVISREYLEIICESVPPPHAQLIGGTVVTLVNTVLWTLLAAILFLIRRSLQHRWHASQRI